MEENKYPRPKNPILSAHFKYGEIDLIKRLAAEQNISIAEFIRRAVRKELMQRRGRVG